MAAGEGRKRVSHAPNLLLVLLWHHFCYYKRHRVLLIVTLVIPFIAISLPYLLVYGFSSTSLSDRRLGPMTMITACQRQTISPMSSGPFHYSSMFDCRNPAPIPDSTSGPGCPPGYKCLTSGCVNESTFVEQSLNDNGFCPMQDNSTVPPFHENSTAIPVPGCECTKFQIYDTSGVQFDLCSWLRGRVLYYPNTSEIIEKVMDQVRLQIDQYGDVIAAIDDTSTEDLYNHTISRQWPGYDLNRLGGFGRFKSCFEKAEDRVIGFKTRQEMFDYVKWLNDSLGSGESSSGAPNPILWAAINFETTQEEGRFRYSIMRDDRQKSDSIDKEIYMQDILESAVISVKLNKTKPIAGMWKILPSKCWIRPQDAVYGLMTSLLTVGCIIAFVFAPINFLEQVITEKHLKLREYLSIMGVGDMTLKLSWILFYMIFLVPASILVAVYVHFMYADSMIQTQLSILIVLFILFNLAQMFLAYFISSFMKEPKRVSFVYSFTSSVPAVFAMASFIFGGSQLTGVMLIVCRILSLHCSVPFVLSLCYVVQWQSVWIGADWSHFFHVPNMADGYGGFGESILWMLADCVLYLILAWYFQNVMPGDYGIRRRPYFFLQPSYWMPRRFGDSAKEYSFDTDQLRPDLEPRDKAEGECVLLIDRLTKFYNQEKLGVDRLSMKVYRNEITALLGQNGAGKSTTMNTLVGLLTPTSGRFTVAGLNGENEMGEIKKLIGFVPQHDILYPSMTVEEHLQFFGWLKGMSTKEIKTTTYAMLTQFGMDSLKHMVTTKLSGGQKRKLSVLTAFLGHPELVILDEPTTGVDPFSRRSIWDVLLHHRSATGTILSTHFMDEADMLSDRIAVISEGTLRCVGSPLYLKNKYGRGFRITVACADERGAIEKVKRFFAGVGNGIELTQSSGRDLTFTVPKEYARSQKMMDLLVTIEDRRDEIAISTFGLSEPTLEEAFFQAAELEADTRGKVEEEETTLQLDRTLSTSSSIKYTNRKGIRLWMHQFLAVLVKRAVLTIRSPSSIAMQIILPMTFVAILLLVSNSVLEGQKARLTPVNIYDRFKSNVVFFQNKMQEPSDTANGLLETLVERGSGPRCPNGIDNFKCDGPTGNQISHEPQKITLNTDRHSCDCTHYCPEGNARQVRHWTIPSEDLVYELPQEMDATDWVLAANQSSHWVTGGFQYFAYNHTFGDNETLSQIFKETTPSEYMVVWTRRETMRAMLNAFNNLVLQTYSKEKEVSIDSYIENVHFPSPDDDKPNKSPSTSQLVYNIMSSLFLIYAFTFATFGIAVSVQQERVDNLKELQYVSGVSPACYWLANYLWDFFMYMASVAIVMFFMGVVPNNQQDYLGEYVNMLIPFGLGAIGFIYLISYRFRSPAGVNRVISGTAFIALSASSTLTLFEFMQVTYKLACVPGQSCSDPGFGWALYVNYVLRLMPYYQLADACVLIGYLQGMGMEQVDPYEMDLLGKRMIQAYVMALVWMAILLLMEHSAHGLLGAKCSKNKDTAPAGIKQTAMDEDVQAEETRVLQNGSHNEPVVVKRVSKKYPKARVPAVDAVTFSIPRQQCFGLLGVNGAGKTTLFRIMTGFQPPTSGQTFIEGRNVVSEKLKLARNISYCPQENTLFDNLTVREHLRLFAAFRGVPTANVSAMVESLVEEVGLHDHAHKLAKQLSGGNKRKLNFALALLDYKPVIFLDEPTSGMDPGARRRTWTCIERAVARGSSVVLTSHSMDECEALCHRLVIMAGGRLCCIGSVQYLKDKFGNHYTVKIKLSPDDGGEGRSGAVADLKQYLARKLPTSELTEEHGTMLQYEVGAGPAGMRLSYLFEALASCQNANSRLMESFTLSQVTLERVFVGMAQRQQDQERGYANGGMVNSESNGNVAQL